MSEEDSEEEESSSLAEDDASLSSTVIQQQKQTNTDRDIELLKDIGEYINRTTNRLCKRLVLNESHRQELEVQRYSVSSQTDITGHSSVLPPDPPKEAKHINRPIDSPLAFYEHMSDAERTQLVNEAIATLLNDATQDR